MTAQLTFEYIALCKKAFAVFDLDGQGTISTKDLKHVLKSLGRNPTEAELQDMINEIDPYCKGKVDFPEFLTLKPLSNQIESEEEYIELFRNFDNAGSGLITWADVTKVLSILGEKLTEVELEEMKNEANIDEDGQINYVEFVKMMLSK